MQYTPDYIRITNDSDEVIYLKIGAAAVLNEGIRLAVGGVFEMKRGENMIADYIDGISTSGSKKVSVYAIGSDIADYNASVNDSVSVAENLGKQASLNPNVNDSVSISEAVTMDHNVLEVVVNEALAIAEAITGQGGDDDLSVYEEVSLSDNYNYAIVP